MGKFDTYKIDLKGMQAETQKIEYLLDNLFFANIDSPEVEKGKVKAVVTVTRKSRMFELDFNLEGTVKVACDRCLDEMEVEIATTEKLIVKWGREFAEEGDNVIIIPEEEGEINVAWFIFEFIALAVPMKHVHAPGKCNKTMVGKLNKHVKRESEDETIAIHEDELVADSTETVNDPRWDE